MLLPEVWMVFGFNLNRQYFVVGDGKYTKQNILDASSWDSSLSGLSSYYSYGIRGTSLNNIFICGSFGDALHFNGFSWKPYRNTPGFYDAEFYNLDVKNGWSQW